MTKESLYLHSNIEIVDLSCYTLYSLHFSTFKAILIVQLTFLNFNYGKKFLNFFAYHQATFHVPPVVCRPQFEKHCANLMVEGNRLDHMGAPISEMNYMPLSMWVEGRKVNTGCS